VRRLAAYHMINPSYPTVVITAWTYLWYTQVPFSLRFTLAWKPRQRRQNNTVTHVGFAWLIRRLLDLMIEFIGPLYNWLQQFTNHWHTVIFLRLATPMELFWLPTELSIKSKSHCHWRSVSQSVSQSVLVSSPIWGSFITALQLRSLFLWGALSDERTGLSFTIAASARQRSLSWVRVPWDSRPYFTLSDLRLPFSSPPTTRRGTVEVFDPASTWVWTVHWVWVLCYDRRSVGQSVLV
jgi:hypothetical protein